MLVFGGGGGGGGGGSAAKRHHTRHGWLALPVLTIWVGRALGCQHGREGPRMGAVGKTDIILVTHGQARQAPPPVVIGGWIAHAP